MKLDVESKAPLVSAGDKDEVVVNVGDARRAKTEEKMARGSCFRQVSTASKKPFIG